MRKTERVVITKEGRDKGKVFLLTEMPVMKAEKWAARAILALSRSGVDVQPEGAGMEELAKAGFRSLQRLDFADLEPLMDEMLECIQIVRDPAVPDMAFKLIENDIMEVPTLLQLRAEIIRLHTGFSIAGAMSNLKSGKAPADFKVTPTSRVASAR